MISATLIQDSFNPYSGARACTFVLEYPRFIHAEVMTHRMLSKNSASSRAIPISKMVENIRSNPAAPEHWGKNQAGMQAKEELTAAEIAGAKNQWNEIKEQACHFSLSLANIGVHKQIANRVTEPFQHMKVVLTGTDFNNFFWLRAHPDAQPEFRILAENMRVEMEASEPLILKIGEWHLPFITRGRVNGDMRYYSNGELLDLETAKMLSASLCAQVSYRISNDSVEKAVEIYKRLIESEPCHASPVEHQLKAISYAYGSAPVSWPEGVTHMTREGEFYSGNIRGFVQLRQLIPNNVKKF